MICCSKISVNFLSTVFRYYLIDLYKSVIMWENFDVVVAVVVIVVVEGN